MSRTTRCTAGRKIRLIGSVLRLEAAAVRRRSRRLGDHRSVSAATPVEASGCLLTTAGSRLSNRRLGESRTPALSPRRYWEWNDLEGGKSIQLLADWDRFRTDMLTFMESVEIILCPTAPAPAPLHGEGLETMFNYTLPYSLTGQPCVVVPSRRSRDGLPIGVQIVGRVWREDQAVAAARSIEATIGGWRQPSMI